MSSRSYRRANFNQRRRARSSQKLGSNRASGFEPRWANRRVTCSPPSQRLRSHLSPDLATFPVPRSSAIRRGASRRPPVLVPRKVRHYHFDWEQKQQLPRKPCNTRTLPILSTAKLYGVESFVFDPEMVLTTRGSAEEISTTARTNPASPLGSLVPLTTARPERSKVIPSTWA